jgi:mRNA interferase RelE/StbE
MRKLVIEKVALKELDGFPAKQYRQVASAIFELLNEPAPHYSKSLQGTAYRRIAVGEYRVIYRTDDESVYVVIVGKRNDDDVYKLMQRKI